MKLKISLLVFFIFTCLKTFSQLEDSKIINDAGFEKKSIIVKNDTIVYLHSKIINVNEKKPIILFVQGSKSIPLLFTDKDGVGSIIPFDYKNYTDKFTFVIISRKGIPLVGMYNRDENGYLDENGNVPVLFKKFDFLEYRSFQVEKVLHILYSQSWVNREKIYLIGHSEGYRVVAKYSEKDKYVNKFVFMSADPFNRVAEEISKNRLECFFSNDDKIFQENIDNSLRDAKKLQNIEQKDSKNNDLKNWQSYNSNLTYNSLKKIKKQSLIVYGTDDIISFNNDTMNYLLDNKIFNVLALPNLDHNFFQQEFDELGKPKGRSYHWDDVFKIVVTWLEKNKLNE